MAFEKAAKIQSFEGLMAAPFTGFQPNGKVNTEIIPKYIEYLVSQGVKGAFVNGITGEGLSLSVAERKSIAETWVKHGRIKEMDTIIIQVGANSLNDVLDLATHAEDIGATAIASLPPLFYKLHNDVIGTEQLIEFFKTLSQSAPKTPLMLYHIPSYSGVEICLSEFMPKVRKAVPTFCGANFTSTDVLDLLRCHSLSGDPFKVMSGFDEVLLPCLSSGVEAAVGATYNFMAPLSLRMMEAFKKGDMKEARKLQDIVIKAVDKISKHGHRIACFKAVMKHLVLLDFGSTRVSSPLDAKALESLTKNLKKLKSDEWRRI